MAETSFDETEKTISLKINARELNELIHLLRGGSLDSDYMADEDRDYIIEKLNKAYDAAE